MRGARDAPCSLRAMLAVLGLLIVASASDCGHWLATLLVGASLFAVASYGAIRAFAYCDRRLTFRW